jgi:hypothetical protein
MKIFKSLVKLSSDIAIAKKKISEIDDLKILNGQILTRLNATRKDSIINNIQNAEFKIFSQFGDDGIIQFLIDYLKIETKTFIEFGVADYTESNTRYLLINNNWGGLVMDGSLKNVEFIKRDYIYWKYDLTALHAFVTKKNINSLIEGSGFGGEIGLLHIDIDGNDYWLWKEINGISPIVVVVEYNSVFGNEQPWTIPYQEDFYRTSAHYSNLYYGTSLLSLCDLAEEKGYFFIGCNSNGNNAYFVRKDRINGLRQLNIKEGYVESKFRESRDSKGNLTFLSRDARLQQIKGLEVYNTRTGAKERI